MLCSDYSHEPTRLCTIVFAFGLQGVNPGLFISIFYLHTLCTVLYRIYCLVVLLIDSMYYVLSSQIPPVHSNANVFLSSSGGNSIS
jgi:hypothetical protein